MLLFLAASALGIYALGNGLSGLFEPGRGIDLGWLAVAGVSVLTLFSQMGRVHDTWPHRDERQGRPDTTDQTEYAATNVPLAPPGEHVIS